MPGRPGDSSHDKVGTHQTHQNTVPERLTATRFGRIFLLFLLCIAQFLDTFNSSAFFAAIPTLARTLSLGGNSSVWLVSAYQVTFSSFLLLSGRISDVYSPKLLFCGGLFLFGVLSLISGFLSNGIVFLVLRALIGIAASLTIPSALSILVRIFPNQPAQATAISVFGISVALGNILGLLLGAVITQLSTWRWIFYLEAIAALPVSILAVVGLPSGKVTHGRETRKRLDWVGLVILTAALVLFTLAFTSSSASGWGSAIVIAPLVVCSGLIIAFLVWGRYGPSLAAIPHGIWSFPNVVVLTILSTLPFVWWTTVFLAFTTFWQNVYMWTPINCAVHLLPIGVLAIFSMAASGKLGSDRTRKWILLLGNTLMAAGATLLAFGETSSRYWPLVFPGFCLGTIGTALTFTQANIAFIAAVPPDMAGIAAAIFNTSLQLGATVGVAVFSSIQFNVDGARSASDGPFKGTSVALWFICGACIAAALVVGAFFHRTILVIETDD